MAGDSGKVGNVTRFIPPEALHSVWPFVRGGLEAIKARCTEDWIPEDIYAALKAKASQLYVTDGGFAVVTPQRSPHSGELYLQIWAAYAATQLAYEEGDRLIEQIARNIGAKKIQIESPRKGWERKGFHPVRTVYERIIE